MDERLVAEADTDETVAANESVRADVGSAVEQRDIGERGAVGKSQLADAGKVGAADEPAQVPAVGECVWAKLPDIVGQDKVGEAAVPKCTVTNAGNPVAEFQPHQAGTEKESLVLDVGNIIRDCNAVDVGNIAKRISADRGHREAVERRRDGHVSTRTCVARDGEHAIIGNVGELRRLYPGFYRKKRDQSHCGAKKGSVHGGFGVTTILVESRVQCQDARCYRSLGER